MAATREMVVAMVSARRMFRRWRREAAFAPRRTTWPTPLTMRMGRRSCTDVTSIAIKKGPSSVVGCPLFRFARRELSSGASLNQQLTTDDGRRTVFLCTLYKELIPAWFYSYLSGLGNQ